MSTFTVTVQRLTILPHNNADALELAQVGLYRTVVQKGTYCTGDYALFIPEQAVIPPSLLTELGLEGKLAGKDKNRVKAIRLRGELSQGIVARPQVLEGLDYEQAYNDQTDFAPRLSITKWIPPVPVGMSGEVSAAPDLIRWIDIENIKRLPNVFDRDEMVSATEKIHGTATLITFDIAAKTLFVSSKGLGENFLALKEAEKNLYWRAVKAHHLDDFAQRIAENYPDALQVGIFGETYGAGVQDLSYGANATAHDGLGYSVFDICIVTNTGEKIWLEQDDIRCMAESFGVSMVPELYRGPFDLEILEALSVGPEKISGHHLHTREGIVIRPIPERRSETLEGRAILKFVGGDYLTRKGGTEYE